MKTRLAVLVLAALAATTTIAAALAPSGVEGLAPSAVEEQAMRNVPRITIDEVKALMAKKQVILVDVRDPLSFAEGHMPGAINVPFDHIPNYIDAWKKDKRLIVTYCA
jgi:3-mercaptopyruvate sulfurtransferase SseA